MLTKIALVALGGAIGSVARFGLSSSAARWLGPEFPWGTFAVNGCGCFLFGYLWTLGESRIAYTAEFRAFAFVGVLGGLTTFSSYAFESVTLAAHGRMAAAAINVIGQNVVCGLLFVAGVVLARGA